MPTTTEIETVFSGIKLATQTTTAPPIRDETAPKLGTCHLLALPPELRNQIYELAVVDDEILNLPRRAGQVRPGLLGACHQIRNEAMPLYYSSNLFSINDGRLNGVVHGKDRAASGASKYIQHLRGGHFFDGKSQWTCQLDIVKGRLRVELKDYAPQFGHYFWTGRDLDDAGAAKKQQVIDRYVSTFTPQQELSVALVKEILKVIGYIVHFGMGEKFWKRAMKDCHVAHG